MMRVALFGAGIGREHLEAYRALPSLFDVAMIVDRDVERAKSLGSGIRCEVSLDAAYESEDIDIIDICLPPHLHVDVAQKAMNSGKHVICEKPIATSLEDVVRLRECIEATGRSYFPVFQYRFGPAFLALRELDRRGLLGEPHVASVETHWSRDAVYYDVPWRGTWAGEQGGAVLGPAIHSHDLISHFFGRVSHVSAMLDTRVNDIETEDCAAIAFKLENGALATSSITLGASTDETRLRLVFGRLTATSATNPYTPATGDWTFEARNSKDQAQINAIVKATRDAPVGFVGFLKEVAASLSGESNAAVTFEDGAASIELVTAIYHAARTGQRVTLPLSEEHPLHSGWLPTT